MKRKWFSISLNSFVNLFDGNIKNFKATEDTKLPRDTRIIDIRFNGWKNELDVLIESEEFEELKEGSEIPRINLAVTEINN
jgi:hypothetical protein